MVSAGVADWFPRWLRSHRIRHPHADLPDRATETGLVFYEPWIEEFSAAGVTEPDALTASKRLVALAPHPGQHFRTLLSLASAATRARAAPQAEDPSTALRRQQTAVDSVRCESDRSRWARLPEEAREAYREEVQARFPELAGRAHFVESMARSWYCEPSGRPGPRDPLAADANRTAKSLRRDRGPAFWSTGKPEPNVPAA